MAPLPTANAETTQFFRQWLETFAGYVREVDYAGEAAVPSGCAGLAKARPAAVSPAGHGSLLRLSWSLTYRGVDPELRPNSTRYKMPQSREPR
jgi:hypothetical protein